MPNSASVIDLYSGVGGLSLGAVKANFNLLAAVEREKRIIDSHAINFLTTKHVCADVSLLSKGMLSTLSGLNKGELGGLIGGPPCQGFSTIGKRNILDTRNNLFADFFRHVIDLRPVFFMAENVPGILNEQYSEIRNNAIRTVEKHYNVLEPIMVNASEFGAATTRTRVFFIGVRKDVSGANLIHPAIEKMKTDHVVYVKQALEGLPVKISNDWFDYQSSWQKITTAKSNNKYLTTLNQFFDGLGDEIALSRYIKKREVSGCLVGVSEICYTLFRGKLTTLFAGKEMHPML